MQNIGKRLRTVQNQDLLYLCGLPERTYSDAASDYEFFSALCKAYPQCKGHTAVAEAEELIRREYGFTPVFTPENCDTIWKLCSAISIGTKKKETALFLPKNTENTAKMPQKYRLSSFVGGELLMPRGSYTEWEASLCRQQEVLQKCGVYLDLGRDFASPKPSLYHVKEALSKEKREAIDINLLKAQLLRLLFSFCVPVLIRAEGDCTGVICLFEHFLHTVGISSLYCVAATKESMDAYLRFATEKKPPNFRLCLFKKDLENTDFLNKIQQNAAFYPQSRWMLIEEN